MKKPIATEIVDVGARKRQEKLVNARLTVARAQREIQNHPQARATVLIKDMRLALQELIDELA